MDRLNRALYNIYSSIPHMEFIGVIDEEEGTAITMWTYRWENQQEVILSALSEIVRETLKDFINITIETENSYFLISKIEETPCSLICCINKKGNIGLLRAFIRKAMPEIKKFLK